MIEGNRGEIWAGLPCCTILGVYMMGPSRVVQRDCPGHVRAQRRHLTQSVKSLEDIRH